MVINEAPADTPEFKPSGANRLLSNLLALGASQLTTWTVTLAWTLIVPRLLGPKGTGLLVLAWSVIGLMQILGGFVSRTLLVREIAARPTVAGSLLAAALIGRLLSVPLCFAATAAYAWLGGFDSTHREVVMVAAAVAATLLLMEPAQAAFQAWEEMKYLAYGEVINKSLTALLGIGLVMLGFGPLALVWVMAVAGLVVLFLNACWLGSQIRLQWHEGVRQLLGLVKASTGFWAYTFFYTGYLWVDSTMLALMAPAHVLGWYGVPTRLFGTLLFVPVILGTVWLPRLAAAWAEDPNRFRQIAARPLELTMVLSLPVGLGAAVVAPGLMLDLYGSEFLPAVPVLQLLALTAIPMYCNIIVFQILVAAGRQNLWTGVLGVAGILNLLLNLVLIRHFQAAAGNGAIGAGLALLITELLVALAGFYLIRLHVDWAQIARVGRAVPAVLVMALAALATRGHGFILQAVVGVLVFAILVVLFRVLTPGDMAELRSLADRVGRRTR